MTKRTGLLVVILGISAFALLIRVFDPIDRYRDSKLRQPVSPPAISKNAKDIIEAIARAEEIADPIERCKAIPVPTGINWSPASINAFCADVYTPTIWWNELKGNIESGSGKILDARFDRLIAGYFSGEIPEGALRSAYYYNFDGSSALRERLTSQWLTASPNSPHALTASGLVHAAAAVQYRGDRFISNTPKSQLDDMHRELNLALRDLKRALEINPRIMPAYEAIVDVARLIGDDDLASEYLQKCRSIDPHNYYALFGYSTMQEPRWGGSMQKLEEIAAQAKDLLPTNPRMANLIASIRAYPASVAARQNNKQEEFRVLHEAVAEGPHSITIGYYAKLCAQRRDYLKAYEMYTQILRYSPNDLDALHGRANAAIPLLAYEYARKDIRAFLRAEPTHLDGLRFDAYLDLLVNDFMSAKRKYEFILNSNPVDVASIQQVAWIAVFRTQDIALARKMIDRGFVLAPHKGIFHWLNWELVRRTDRKNLKEITQDFIAHADKNDERQVEALRYTADP